MVPYVDAGVSVTVMRVLLFVLHVCILRECEDARVTAMLVWGRKRCGCGECRTGNVGDTRRSGIVSSTADVLVMSVWHGIREVGGVCEMCMCVALGGVGGDGLSI